MLKTIQYNFKIKSNQNNMKNSKSFARRYSCMIVVSSMIKMTEINCDELKKRFKIGNINTLLKIMSEHGVIKIKKKGRKLHVQSLYGIVSIDKAKEISNDMTEYVRETWNKKPEPETKIIEPAQPEFNFTDVDTWSTGINQSAETMTIKVQELVEMKNNLTSVIIYAEKMRDKISDMISFVLPFIFVTLMFQSCSNKEPKPINITTWSIPSLLLDRNQSFVVDVKPPSFKFLREMYEREMKLKACKEIGFNTDASEMNETEKYIFDVFNYAVSESKRVGMPASFKLATAILESNRGKSKLTKESGNHFGIKCFEKNCTSGHCVNHEDDDPDDRFKCFASVEQAFKAHSDFLKKQRYNVVWEQPIDKPEKWCLAVHLCGYATSKTYSTKLISLINTYDLKRFDLL